MFTRDDARACAKANSAAKRRTWVDCANKVLRKSGDAEFSKRMATRAMSDRFWSDDEFNEDAWSEEAREAAIKARQGKAGAGGPVKKPSRGWREKARAIASKTPEGVAYLKEHERASKVSHEFSMGRASHEEYHASQEQFGRIDKEYGEHIERIRAKLRAGG